jgi:putative DNA primase/helicase
MMTPDPFARIAEMIEGADGIAAPREPHGIASEARDGLDEAVSDEGTEAGPSDSDFATVDGEILKLCCGYDHSDTDNGKRLLAHFGSELRVLKQGDAKTPTYTAWVHTHWDVECGNLYAHAVAQRLGGRIGLEADVMAQTAYEARLIADGDQAADDLDALEKRKADWDEADAGRARVLRRVIEAGEAARDALSKRKTARRKFAVSSKNKSRIEAMMICAAPFCGVDPDVFNPDPFVFSTRAHTLRFLREPDLECPDPDAVRYKVRVEATDGHRREDMLTRYAPLSYKPGAECPKWLAFLDECLPDASVREFVQTFSGLGLLGRTVQMVVFHYGLGANGKSVFLETLMRVLGPLAVGLPAESITGQGDRSAGGASPDLARLYGARALCVLELPAGKPLHEDLLKKLTGGEKIPVRTLFKGYFEFTPIFTCHMSGNGYPRIDGTDNGIWRRMAVVHWPVTIPVERRREMEDVLADFAPEYPGILNWLIDGAVRFIESGLRPPESVRAATAEYRSEMDPISDFIADCVEVWPDGSVTARTMYDAYVSWSMASARKPIFETKFANVMKTRFTRLDERIRRYIDCRL